MKNKIKQYRAEKDIPAFHLSRQISLSFSTTAEFYLYNPGLALVQLVRNSFNVHYISLRK